MTSFDKSTFFEAIENGQFEIIEIPIKTHRYHRSSNRKPKHIPKITKCGRLRNSNMGHYDSYFNINNHGDILEIKYLPEIKSDPRKFYYKSATKKSGDFLYIQDICSKIFGPEPDTKEGWHYNLETIYRNDEQGMAKYRIIMEEQWA